MDLLVRSAGTRLSEHVPTPPGTRLVSASAPAAARPSVPARRVSIALGAGLLLILLAVTFKGSSAGDLDLLAESGFVAFLRSAAVPIGLVGAGVLAITVVSSPRIRPVVVGGPIVWFLLFRLLMALRMLPEGGGGYFLSFALMSIVFLGLAAAVVQLGIAQTTCVTIYALFVWSLCTTLIDIYLYAFELNLYTWKGRFYGLFVHPNFLAMSQACAIGAALAYQRSSRDKGKKDRWVLPIIVIAGSVVLIVATGSRSGMLSAVAVFFVYAYLRFKRGPAFLMLLLAVGTLVLAGGLDWLSEALANSRGWARALGAGNTRGEVWSVMARSFAREPFFGAGSRAGATSGSYLRVLAMGGLVVGIPFLASMWLGIRSVWREPRGGFASPHWFPLLAAILVSAVFEGFLGEAVGFGGMASCVILSLMSFRATAGERANQWRALYGEHRP